MSEPISSQLAALLLEVLDLEPKDRQAWLDCLRAHDPAQAQSLQSLIDLDECAELPLDRSIARVTRIEPPDESPLIGQRHGPWQLLGKLGQGGMGSVWLAERADGEFAQRAALKLLRLDMDSVAARERFRRERELLARLTHPDIAHLLDGGIDVQGQPWFAMELIEGQTLAQWMSRSDISQIQRLSLLIRLARAVGFAHRHLIVHRDLKPANVMVRADGSPCLLDFGIARLLQDDETQTHTAQALLTPAYAAPEQRRGEPVSTSADVYALGVILHELLTGQRPASTPDPSDAIANAPNIRRNRTPQQSALRGDLKAIVQRATAEEPLRRYTSAEALAEDLERHLLGRPVLARPDTLIYRCGRLLRRNPVASSVITLSVLAFFAAGATALWQARAKSNEAERAQLALRQSEAAHGFIVALLADIDPATGRGSKTPIGDLLAPAEARIVERFDHDPAVAAELLAQIGEIHVSLGEAEQARHALTAALDFNARAPTPSPALAAEARARLAHYVFMDGQGEKALSEFESIIIALRLQTDPRARRQLAKTLELRAHVQHALGRGEDALTSDRESLDILRTLGEEAGTELVYLLIGHADLCAALDRPEEALAAAEEVLASTQVRNAHSPGLIADAHGARARALQALGRFPEAETEMVATLTRFAQVYGKDSARTQYWNYRHAQVLQALGRLDEAQVEVDALIASPASDAQPAAPIAHQVLAADLALARHATDAAERIALARNQACAKPEFAVFCAKARALQPD